MQMATSCITCFLLTRPCIGQIHLVGNKVAIHVLASQRHPALTWALFQSSLMYMVQLVLAMKVMDTRKHGIYQMQRTSLQAMRGEVLGMTTSEGKRPRGMELHGDPDLLRSSIQTI